MEVYRKSRVWRSNYEVIEVNDLLINRSFRCSACYRSTPEEEVIPQGRGKYCWQCFQNTFGLKCASCWKFITGLDKMSFVFYNGQVWHGPCFCCFVCGKSLETQRDLIQEKGSVYCKPCGEGAVFRIG